MQLAPQLWGLTPLKAWLHPPSPDGWLGHGGQNTDDGDGICELLVLQGQLVDNTDEGFLVGPQFDKFLLVCRTEFLDLHDLSAQPHFGVGRLARFLTLA